MGQTGGKRLWGITAADTNELVEVNKGIAVEIGKGDEGGFVADEEDFGGRFWGANGL